MQLRGAPGGFTDSQDLTMTDLDTHIVLLVNGSSVRSVVKHLPEPICSSDMPRTMTMMVTRPRNAGAPMHLPTQDVCRMPAKPVQLLV